MLEKQGGPLPVKAPTYRKLPEKLRIPYLSRDCLNRLKVSGYDHSIVMSSVYPRPYLIATLLRISQAAKCCLDGIIIQSQFSNTKRDWIFATDETFWCCHSWSREMT